MKSRMTIDMNTLFTGKPTKIKGLTYASTREYVQPFVDMLSGLTDEFIIQVKPSDQMSYTQYGDDNVFNSVWIQAVLSGETMLEGYKETIGIAYGLKTKKPVIKFYKGVINTKYKNLIMFDKSLLSISELLPSTKIDYSFVDKLIYKNSTTLLKCDALANINLAKDEKSVDSNLGSWIKNIIKHSIVTDCGTVKLSTDVAISAYRKLYESVSSPYHIDDEKKSNLMNVYNAFSSVVSVDDACDIVNKPEKILLLKNVLGLYWL